MYNKVSVSIITFMHDILYNFRSVIFNVFNYYSIPVLIYTNIFLQFKIYGYK